MSSGELPTLWHLKVSHYNEKARWTLDYKHVPHRRRPAVPGRHKPIARKLRAGDTFPVLILDGEPIGDSTRIIEALERHYPEPPLYPADPGDRSRALELEDYFDEQLGPYTRRLAVHHLLPDRELLLGAFFQDVTGSRRRMMAAAYPAVRRAMTSTLEIDDRTVAAAFERLREVGACFRADLPASGYLVGGSFSVADLTLAALLAPLVAPEQFPYPQPQRGHARFAPVREALDEHGLADWAREIYARHRGRSAEVTG
jgi:glutathione S-transferase